MASSEIFEAGLPASDALRQGPQPNLPLPGTPARLDASSTISTPSQLPSSPEERGGPDHLVHHGLAPASSSLTASPTSIDASISQPFPLPSRHPDPLHTPLQEQHQPDLTSALTQSLPPLVNVSLPASPVVRTAHNLRLPSFDLLGIANPHPDNIAQRHSHNIHYIESIGAGPLSKPEDPLHALSPPLARPQHESGVQEPTVKSPEAARAHVEQQIPTVTPPPEPGAINWGSFVNIRTAGVGSPPRSDPAVSPSINTVAGWGSAGPASTPPNPLSVADLSDALGMAVWVETVKATITSNFHSETCDAVKVLSHALPCPSLTGHLFGQIIAGIHEKTVTSTAWINVFHALPGRYTLLDLPKSPPSTPGPAVGGEEYFTTKVFDSAVAVADYQLESKLLPPSPRPVVPPGSVNVSIVERYIPPTNVHEFSEMFRFHGRSLLYDRLVELSASNGLLLFIYPTRAGGRTFMQDYLGPVLDPLLRSVTVVHDLTSELGKALGQMVAVDHLAEYDSLHASMQNFCERLTNDPSTLSGPCMSGATYTIIHASKEEVYLDRQAWASDWWIKQEKSRVRDLVTKFFRKKLPSSELTPTTLIQEILDGVAHRESSLSGKPRGVEMGVFIIKKST